MAKKITSKSIAEEGFLKSFKEEFKTSIEVVQALKEELKDLAKLMSGKLENANENTAEGIELIAELTQEVNKLKKDNQKLLNQEEKLKKSLNKVVEKENKLKEQLIKGSDEEVKGKIRLQKANREQKRLLEAELILRKEQVETLSDVRERIKALRIVASQQNVTTEEGRAQIQAYNDEINELTETLKDNSDTFIQNKINVGNYTESIKEAVDISGALGEQLGPLGGILTALGGFIQSNTKATDANTKALNTNKKATVGLAKASKALNNVLKASIIGAIVALVLSLGAAFTQGQKGAISLQKATATLTIFLQSTIKVLAGIGSGLFAFFQGLFVSISGFFQKIGAQTNVFQINIEKAFLFLKNPIPALRGEDFEKSLSDIEARLGEAQESVQALDEEIENAGGGASEGFDKFIESIKSIPGIFSDAKEAAIEAIDDIDARFRRGFELQQVEIQVEKLNAELEKTQQIADDDTISLREQRDAALEALDIQTRVAQARNQESAINLRNLNAEIKLSLLKSRTELESLGISRDRIDALVALQSQEAEGEQLLENQIKFAQEFLDISEKTAGESFLPTPEQLQRVIDGTKEAIAVQAEGEVQLAEAATKRRQIERDLFEQNLDLLIDLIDKEKTLSEQFVNDTTRNFESRVQEFDRFFQKFSDNLQKELNEFNKNTSERGLDIPLNVNFEEDGTFQVFLKDQELALDNIEELNNQLQSAKFSEIEINRFREFVQDANDGKRDFLELRKEIELSRIALGELSREEAISGDQLDQIKELSDSLPEFEKIDVSQLDQDEVEAFLKQLEDFENEKTRIEEEAERSRNLSRQEAINKELETVEKGSERELELLAERNELERELEEKRLEGLKDFQDKLLKQEEETNKQIEQANKNRADRIRDIAETTDQILKDLFDKQLERIDKELSVTQDRQSKLIEAKQKGAEGATESLAFEIKREAELQRERQRVEERQRKLELASSVLKAYAANLEDPGVQDPLSKTFSDTIKLREFIAALPAFWSGAERIGDVADAQLKGRDGVIIRADKEERIMSVADSMRVRGLSNKELADLGEAKLAGGVVDVNQAMAFPVATPVESNKTLERKVDKLIKVTEDLPDRMPINGFEVDEWAKMVKTWTGTKKRKEITNRRLDSFING